MTQQRPLNKKVLIVQQVFKQYRLAFFQQLALQLASDGFELTLCFSLPQGNDLAKADNISVPPAAFALLVPLKTFGPLVWQEVPDCTAFDLVIVEQANRHLLNYLLLGRRLLGLPPKLIFWGHGFNHQASTGLWSSLKEHYKRWLLRYADGFFAYTQPVADYAQQQGVDPQRITVLNNSIDTAAFRTRVQSLGLARQPSPISTQTPTTGFTLLYCGALYPDKNIPLLLQTARYLAEQQQLTRLIVLGDGPERHLLVAEQAAQQALWQQDPQQHAVWLDYRGACFGEDKAAAYAEADLVLHPGLVGLAVLDAFAAGLPLITTDFRGHSPEICYLVHGYNGLIVPETSLPEALLALLQAPEQLAALAAGAVKSSDQYSLASMVQAFAAGVRKSLLETP